MRFCLTEITHTEIHDINKLSREDIPFITNLPDTNSSRQEFNDRVMSHTDGFPQVVKSIGDAVLKNDGECLSEEDLQENFSSLNNFFKQRKEKWDSRALRAILPILSVFEPITELPINILLLVINSKNIDIEIDELREELDKLSNDLISTLEDCYKLRVRLFAEYLINGLQKMKNKKCLSQAWSIICDLLVKTHCLFQNLFCLGTKPKGE